MHRYIDDTVTVNQFGTVTAREALLPWNPPADEATELSDEEDLPALISESDESSDADDYDSDWESDSEVDVSKGDSAPEEISDGVDTEPEGDVCDTDDSQHSDGDSCS